MEAELRELERTWQSSGDHHDLVRLLRARLRAGFDPARLAIAAGFYHPAAQEALGLPINTSPSGIILGRDGKIMARVIPQCLDDIGDDGRFWDPLDEERDCMDRPIFQIGIRLEALRIMANVLMQIQEWMLRRARMMYGVSPDASGARERIINIQNMIDQAIEDQNHNDNWYRMVNETSDIIDDFRGALVQVKRSPYNYDDANAELREKLLNPVFAWSLGHTESSGDSILPDFPKRRRRNPSFDENYRTVERRAAGGDLEAAEELIHLSARMGAPVCETSPCDEEIDPIKEYDEELSRGCAYDCAYGCEHSKPVDYEKWFDKLRRRNPDDQFQDALRIYLASGDLSDLGIIFRNIHSIYPETIRISELLEYDPASQIDVLVSYYLSRPKIDENYYKLRAVLEDSGDYELIQPLENRISTDDAYGRRPGPHGPRLWIFARSAAWSNEIKSTVDLITYGYKFFTSPEQREYPSKTHAVYQTKVDEKVVNRRRHDLENLIDLDTGSRKMRR
jgi:hypothetical protein